MNYVRPESLADYFELMATGAATLLAGGTDLMPRYEQGLPMPERMVDIKRIRELKGIAEVEGGLEIGALTTIEQLKQSEVIRDRYTSLWLATQDFAAVQIRHRATLGGNICNASPAGDTLPPLYAFGAQVHLAGAGGERTLPIDRFVLGPGKVDLKPGELLRSVFLPDLGDDSTFFKLGLRRAMAISVVNFALLARVEAGRFRSLAITAGAVAPTVVPLTSLAGALTSEPIRPEEAIDLVDQDIDPIDDLRATARYRTMALKNVLQFTLNRMLEQAHE